MTDSRGMVAITAARRRSTAIISRLRFRRSTHAPMISPNNRYGTKFAAVAIPRFTAEWVSWKINSGVAKSVNELPSWEIVCPAQNFQKSGLSRWRSAAGALFSMSPDYIEGFPPPVGRRTIGP